jgi:hypothetical protein
MRCATSQEQYMKNWYLKMIKKWDVVPSRKAKKQQTKEIKKEKENNRKKPLWKKNIPPN